VVRENWYRDIWLLAITVLVVWSIATLYADRTDRADQTCTLFERAHERDVNALAATYKYLVGLSDSERTSAINRTVLARLPETEQQARVTKAPSYCDDRGVGLPEPNPVIPVRPSSLR
jgi:hypothetical protein